MAPRIESGGGPSCRASMALSHSRASPVADARRKSSAAASSAAIRANRTDDTDLDRCALRRLSDEVVAQGQACKVRSKMNPAVTFDTVPESPPTLASRQPRPSAPEERTRAPRRSSCAIAHPMIPPTTMIVRAPAHIARSYRRT